MRGHLFRGDNIYFFRWFRLGNDRITFPAVCLLLLLQSLWSQPVNAEHPTSTGSDVTFETTPEAELKLPGVTGANVTHSFVSTGVERLARKIDSFFGEDRIYQEASGTYLQIRGSLIYQRGGEFEFDGKFRAKIDLPQLEEKLHLEIESSDEKDADEEINRITTGTTLVDELQDADVSATLQFIIKEKRKWNLSIRPGLKISDPVETFIKLRFRRSQALGKTWLSRGTVEVGFFSRRGWENEWELDLERGFGDRYLFRSSSTVFWREKDPGNQTLRQSFLLTHILDRRQSLAFETGTTAETHPTLRDLSYFSSLRYRRDIHRGWLFLELKPQVLFARENSYRADPALVLTLETLFGSRYLEKQRAPR